MFGFRLKAKSEHEAALVLSWYGDGATMERRRSVEFGILHASCVGCILRIAIRSGRIQSRCSTSKIAMRLRHPGSHGGKGYFLSVRSETNLARSKKDSWESCPRAFSRYSQVDSGWWI